MANTPTAPGRWNVEPPPLPAKIKVVSEGGYTQHFDNLQSHPQPHPVMGIVPGQATDDDREAQRRLAQPLLENLKP